MLNISFSSEKIDTHSPTTNSPDILTIIEIELQIIQLSPGYDEIDENISPLSPPTTTLRYRHESRMH